jgi:cytochrome c peroxidase
MLAELIVVLSIPLGLDRYLPVPDDNPLSPGSIELGRQLFFDSRLSRDGTLSCASCHDPDRAFADSRPIAVGIDGRRGRRNTPALINRGYGRAFFWDGRAVSLEDQVLQPIADPDELGSSLSQAESRLGLPGRDIGRALASFVRSILSAGSRFDRFMFGASDALTLEEQSGLRIFRQKGNCVSCHVGPNLTDERLHNTGIAWGGQGFVADRGAGGGDFKTPTLRDVARTAPYMHDGSIATLEEVIDFYDGGGRPNPALDVQIRRLGLTPLEKQQLAAFLRTLSGEIQFGAPSTAAISLAFKALVQRTPALRESPSHAPVLHVHQSHEQEAAKSSSLFTITVSGSAAVTPTSNTSARWASELISAHQRRKEFGDY